MKRNDLFSLDLSGKAIVIIGSPASGKTTLSKALAAKFGQRVIHTDDYIEHGYKEALYAMLPDILESEQPLIVEGMQAYRLLRKGVELETFYPDVVIELEVTPQQVARVYMEERIWDKRKSLENTLKNVAAFNKMHQTILADYRAMDNPRPPKWYTVQNRF